MKSVYYLSAVRCRDVYAVEDEVDLHNYLKTALKIIISDTATQQVFVGLCGLRNMKDFIVALNID